MTSNNNWSGLVSLQKSFAQNSFGRIIFGAENDLADAFHNNARMKTEKDRPEGVSDSDWNLFEARRRAERSQIDVDEGRITPAERTRLITQEFKRGD